MTFIRVSPKESTLCARSAADRWVTGGPQSDLNSEFGSDRVVRAQHLHLHTAGLLAESAIETAAPAIHEGYFHFVEGPEPASWDRLPAHTTQIRSETT